MARALAPFLRGDRYECTVCGGRFRRLLPMGGRPDALCPRCGSLERHRLLWLFLQRRTDLFTSAQRVLHVAPEYCFCRRLARLSNLDYVSVDLALPFAMVQADVEELPFADQDFDVVICSHVLDDVDDDRRAMRELHRVLRPSGWSILQSPVEEDDADTVELSDVPPDRRGAVFDRGSVRNYGRDYFDRLREAGFAVEEVPYADSLGRAAVERHALTAGEKITFCRRENYVGLTCL